MMPSLVVMGYRTLTNKPRVPALVRVAAMGALAIAGCGDDGAGGESNSSDVFPTAGECVHAQGMPCATTGGDGMDGMETMVGGESNGMDAAPTTPCAHDPSAPGCGSTGNADTTAGSGDTVGGTGDSTSSGSGSSGDSSGGTTTGGSGG